MAVRSFTNTRVSVANTMTEIEKTVMRHGITEQSYTRRDPTSERPEGQLIYQFIWGRGEGRRGVRITVGWREARLKKDSSTPQMAARALFWFLKAKFDAIDYGIEEFDVAFMPHLITALGTTYAETPEAVAAVLADPTRLSLAATPAPYQLPAGVRSGPEDDDE